MFLQLCLGLADAEHFGTVNITVGETVRDLNTTTVVMRGCDCGDGSMSNTDGTCPSGVCVTAKWDHFMYITCIMYAL
jgi:hypothetical protein